MTPPLRTKQKKLLVVPMTLSMHTRLKWRAKSEGRPMASIVRELVDEYLESPPAKDVYEELSEAFAEILS